MPDSALSQTEELPAPVDTIGQRVQGLLNAGAKLFGEGQVEPARLHFIAALMLDPLQHTALQNLGAALRNLSFYPASEAVAARSVKITKGENPWCLSNLGVAQLGTKKYDESYSTLKKVTEMLPDSAPSWQNFGLVCYLRGNYDEALEALGKSLDMKYDHHCASDKSLTLLSMGRVQEGLELYDKCRWNIIFKSPVWEWNIPEWQGESLEGRRILVHHEQGFGDSLMLARFIRQLAMRRCHITLAVPKTLVRLFQRSYPFVRVFDFESEAPTEGYDYHSPLLSVMRWIGIRAPKDISGDKYLRAPEEKFPMALPKGRVKVGICWASGNHSPALADRRRIVSPTLFLPLLEDLDVSLVSLQVGPDSKALVANGLEGIIFDPSAKITDFADTAALMNELDLIISVDSAVAHLAGALGKPCLMLSPYSRCWRWWGKTTGWPWYNRMKIYHQEPEGGWATPVREAVEKALWVIRGIR